MDRAGKKFMAFQKTAGRCIKIIRYGHRDSLHLLKICHTVTSTGRISYLCSQFLRNMFEIATSKVQDETRQGEAYAPFDNDPNLYKRHFYIESYGCQMNFSDSEIVASILAAEGFGATRHVEDAALILLNTCSIREKAEQTVRKRLTEFKKLKKKAPFYFNRSFRLHG